MSEIDSDSDEDEDIELIHGYVIWPHSNSLHGQKWLYPRQDHCSVMKQLKEFHIMEE
jgi:hypothetical protein